MRQLHELHEPDAEILYRACQGKLCLSGLCVVYVSVCKRQGKRDSIRWGKKATYNTRRCLSPAKSALVILVRLFAFRSLDREVGKEIRA